MSERHKQAMADPDCANVQRFLDISTGHLRLSTREALARGETPEALPLVALTEYGYFFYVPEEIGDVPDDLRACLEAAQERHCGYLMIDSDAATLDGLTYYGDGETMAPIPDDGPRTADEAA